MQFQGGVGFSNGILYIRPVGAQLTHDTDLFMKMDPYCVFINGGYRVKTSTCYNGGKKPYWNEQIELNANSQDRVTIEIWDHEVVGSNNVIGLGELQVSKVIAMGGNYNDFVPLFYHGKPAGNLSVSASFVQKGGFQQQQGFVQQQAYVQPQQNFVQQQPTYIQPQQGFVQQQAYVQPQQTYVQPQQTFVQQQPTFIPQQTYVQPQQTFVQQQPTFIPQPQFQQQAFIQQPVYTQPQVILQPQPTVVVEEVFFEKPHHHHHHHHKHGFEFF